MKAGSMRGRFRRAIVGTVISSLVLGSGAAFAQSDPDVDAANKQKAIAEAQTAASNAQTAAYNAQAAAAQAKATAALAGDKAQADLASSITSQKSATVALESAKAKAMGDVGDALGKLFPTIASDKIRPASPSSVPDLKAQQIYRGNKDASCLSKEIARNLRGALADFASGPGCTTQNKIVVVQGIQSLKPSVRAYNIAQVRILTIRRTLATAMNDTLSLTPPAPPPSLAAPPTQPHKNTNNYGVEGASLTSSMSLTAVSAAIQAAASLASLVSALKSVYADATTATASFNDAISAQLLRQVSSPPYLTRSLVVTPPSLPVEISAPKGESGKAVKDADAKAAAAAAAAAVIAPVKMEPAKGTITLIIVDPRAMLPQILKGEDPGPFDKLGTGSSNIENKLGLMDAEAREASARMTIWKQALATLPAPQVPKAAASQAATATAGRALPKDAKTRVASSAASTATLTAALSGAGTSVTTTASTNASSASATVAAQTSPAGSISKTQKKVKAKPAPSADTAEKERLVAAALKVAIQRTYLENGIAELDTAIKAADALTLLVTSVDAASSGQAPLSIFLDVEQYQQAITPKGDAATCVVSLELSSSIHSVDTQVQDSALQLHRRIYMESSGQVTWYAWHPDSGTLVASDSVAIVPNWTQSDELKDAKSGAYTCN